MRIGYTEKQVGHMTLYKWKKLYKSYQKLFDNELILTASRKTYEEAFKPVTLDDIIPE